jgi:cell division protein FtsL
MATERWTRRYGGYGKMAYQPEYDGNAARSPSRRQVEQPRQRPRVQPRERVTARPSVQVREQGAVSLFAIVGFVAVAVCVFLLLSTGAQLAMVADETFDLESELSDLKTEEKKLEAQYELAYDLSAIETEMTSSGAMVRASSSNTVYLNMAESDSVIYYAQSAEGVNGLVDWMEDLFSGLMS